MMSTPSFRVIKLGGSLLKTGSVLQLPIWLAEQTGATNVVIVGGGPFVDVIREFDDLWGLAAEVTHWLSVRAMGLTAQLVSHQIAGAEIVSSLDGLRKTSANLCVFAVEDFLRNVDSHSASPLPCGWDVTSDSIAARVAAEIAARELVLLKSCLPAMDMNWQQLADSGYVDNYFPEVVRDINSVRCVNARFPGWPETTMSRVA